MLCWGGGSPFDSPIPISELQSSTHMYSLLLFVRCPLECSPRNCYTFLLSLWWEDHTSKSFGLSGKLILGVVTLSSGIQEKINFISRYVVDEGPECVPRARDRRGANCARCDDLHTWSAVRDWDVLYREVRITPPPLTPAYLTTLKHFLWELLNFNPPPFGFFCKNPKTNLAGFAGQKKIKSLLTSHFEILKTRFFGASHRILTNSFFSKVLLFGCFVFFSQKCWGGVWF